MGIKCLISKIISWKKKVRVRGHWGILKERSRNKEVCIIKTEHG